MSSQLAPDIAVRGLLAGPAFKFVYALEFGVDRWYKGALAKKGVQEVIVLRVRGVGESSFGFASFVVRVLNVRGGE